MNKQKAIKITSLFILLLIPIVWRRILVYFFGSSIGDMIGLPLLIIFTIFIVALFLITYKRIKSNVKRIIFLFFLVLIQLLVQPLLHYSFEKPYKSIKMTISYLENYDTISRVNLYEPNDLIISSIAKYKYSDCMPDRAYSVYLSKGNTGQKSKSYFIEFRNKNIRFIKDSCLSYEMKNDSILFHDKIDGLNFNFCIANNRIFPSFNTEKGSQLLDVFEFRALPNFKLFDVINNYLEKKKYPKKKY